MNQPTLPAPRPAVTRSLSRGWLGGVAAGVSDHLGVNPVVVRAAFALLASWRLLGVVAYVVLWLLLPREGAAREAPGLDAALRRGLRSGSEPGAVRRGDLGQVLAVGLLGVGLLWLVQSLGWGLSPTWLIAALVASAGLALVWWQADRLALRETPSAPTWRRWVEPLYRHWTTVVALAVGVALVAVAIGVTVATLPGLGDVARTVVAIALAVSALGLLAAPWLMRARHALALAREAKLVSDARADMAAHLHDSVLQTLALIQRQAYDPHEVSRLARRQERELRGWLYAEHAMADTLRRALTDAAQEIEDDFPVRVECVVVGEVDLTPRLAELVRAAREAMLNAAKHSGAAVIDVYAEADADRVEVFVRDRGKGFDPDAVAEDRLGIKGSIMERMQRHHGTARIRSSADTGTDVRLEMTA